MANFLDVPAPADLSSSDGLSFEDPNLGTATYSEGGAATLVDPGQDALVSDSGEGFAVNRVATGFTNPLYVAAAPDGSGRVFVLEKGGAIKILDPDTGTIASTPFLDLGGSVGTAQEQGLLGFAAAPDFATSGVFYVYVSTPQGPNEVRRYNISSNPDVADPASGHVIYRTTHGSEGFHNGGWIGFDADGLLYVAVGDGNDAAQGFQNAQDLQTSLGKILRLDVSGDDFPDDPARNFAVPDDNPYSQGGGLPEIFASGFRNPFRASFDTETGKLYVADVGQGVKEEIDVLGLEDAGKNYGWPWFEGTSPYGFGGDASLYQMPDAEYSHGSGPYQGNSITGGYVYRGPIEALKGEYFFGDFVRRNIWSLDTEALDTGGTVPAEDFTIRRANLAPDVGTINLISSFGEDEARNLYIVDYLDGEIYRLGKTDEANFAGGTLHATVSGGAGAGDTLAFATGTGVTLSAGMTVGSVVSVGGVVIGSILPGETGQGGSDLSVSFGGGATAARVQILTRALTYANVDEGATGTRAVMVTLDDGDLGPEHRQSIIYTVAIAAENDAPQVTGFDTAVTVIEDDAPVALDANAAIRDPELDLVSYAGATLTLERLGGGSVEDVYGVTGRAAISQDRLLVDGVDVGLVDATGAKLAISFGTGASPVLVQVVLQSLTYANSSDTPPAAVTIGYTFSDGNQGEQGSGGALVATGSLEVVITPSDDPARLLDDAFDTDEATAITGNIFADNGAGADTDADGPTLMVTAADGATGAVGQTIMLSSGALVRVSADGTFDYDPNGAFDRLAAPGSGASNIAASDSFTYSVGGSTATVRITVGGLASDADEFVGSVGSDRITGSGRGDLFLVQQGGEDTLFGGDGDDVFLMGEGFDTADRIDGGDGNDRIEVAGSVQVALAGGKVVSVEQIVLRDAANGGSANYRLTADDTFVADGATATIRVAGAAATLVFDGAAEMLGRFELVGGNGDDILTTGGGADLLIGGAGPDVLTGGSGEDVYGVDGQDVVIEASGEGYDTVYADESFALTVGSSVEVLSTSGWNMLTALDLTGNELVNRLFGNAGSNMLDGGGGADVMTGFGGEDFYRVDNVGDRVREAAGDGTDTVATTVSWALADGTEIEILRAADPAATDRIDLSGNALDNALEGNAGANTLDGGRGADLLTGYDDDDIYGVDDAGDRVVEQLSGGYDTVYASVSWAAAASQEVEVISTASWRQTTAIDLTGNEFANRLFGNAGRNFLDGGTGADTMTGFAGDDFYAVDNAGDVVIEAAGGGYDSVYVGISWTLSENSAVEVVSAADWRAATALSISGNASANQLFGNAGDNVLNGGGGSDVLTGFGGADRFSFSTALSPANIDTISDFQSGLDRIVLDRSVFGTLAEGELSTDAFQSGSTAVEADDRILYDAVTGTMAYDADGAGGADAVAFAVLRGLLPLRAEDFWII